MALKVTSAAFDSPLMHNTPGAPAQRFSLSYTPSHGLHAQRDVKKRRLFIKEHPLESENLPLRTEVRRN